jgi:long-chain acyl-CoA synthetase
VRSRYPPRKGLRFLRATHAPGVLRSPAQNSMAALARQLRDSARTHPDKPAVILPDGSWTFGDLERLASFAAANLLAAGIGPGDPVALHLVNGLEIIVAYFACFKTGAIALPINTRFKSSEIEYVLSHANAAAYIGQPDLAREVREWPSTVRLRYVVGEAVDGMRGFGDLLKPSAREAPIAEPSDDQPAAVLYTSGTTARPKGVTHTQRTLAALGQSAMDELFRSDDVVLIPLPLVHMAALLTLVSAVPHALSMVVLPAFTPALFLDMLARHRATGTIGMPVHYRAIVELQKQAPRDVSSGRMYGVGGDSVPTALQDQFTRLFGIPLREAYGLSEIVPVSANPLDDIRCGSLGRAAAGVQVRIVDDRGADVRDGEVGEIAVRAPGTMIGYWNDPAATAAAFRDGWFLTGDLARGDRDGFYWFAGRKKEIIVRGGSNVSPQEVEEAVYQHDAVREVAVVGVPDERLGEIVVACVVRHDGADVSEAELIEFIRGRLSDYKSPERIVFADSLPKGPTGKILRRAVRESLTSAPA